MGEVLVRSSGLWKKYSRDRAAMMRHGVVDTLRSGLGLRRAEHLRNGEFWSLKDISFEVKRGEALGLCGHNGAGKTTLLKSLTGLLQPDRGEVMTRGRISWLVDIGAGLNPNLTGRENVLLRIDMLSLRRDSRRLLAYVEEFSGIGDFLDSPVGFYSSGMKAKLGFAIATMDTPDILIVDETLAVGDLAFRMKCYGRISDIASQAAVLFVSHGMNHVARVCTTGCYLEQGEMKYIGDVQKTIRMYNEAMTSGSAPAGKGFNSGLVRITAINGNPVSGQRINVRCNDPFLLAFDLQETFMEDATFHVLARDPSGNPVMDVESRTNDLTGVGSKGSIECRLADLALAPDLYDFSVMVDGPDGRHLAISEPVRVLAEGRFGSAVSYKPLGEWA